MSTDKNELSEPDPRAALKVMVIVGSILFLGGIAMSWVVFQSYDVSKFWPGLVLGFCFTLFLPYSAIKASKQKTADAKPAKSAGSSWGGLGAGLGVLILGVFHDNELLMINISAAAASLMLGIGFFSIVLAIWKRNKGELNP